MEDEEQQEWERSKTVGVERRRNKVGRGVVEMERSKNKGRGGVGMK